MTIPKLWPGETVYIVGAGPSVRMCDLERLRGRRVIAVNKMFEYLPEASVIYFTDWRVWAWYGDRMREHPAPKYTIATKSRLDHPEVINLGRGKIKGMSERPGTLNHGNNSGYAAIDFAVQAGPPAEVVLYGFDMSGPEGNVHIHQEHPVPTQPRVFKNMLPHFDTLVAPLRERGVHVINATRGGALEVFPRMELERVLANEGRLLDTAEA